MNMLKFDNMNGQRGSMSFLTVIFLAIVLSVVALSFVRISITEQRESVDDDLTIRAFYAAESGIEDAKRAIGHYLKSAQDPADFDALNGDVCAPADMLGPDSGDLDITNLEAEYTCQLIDITPGEFRNELAAWEGVTIPLNGVSSFDQVRISWHEPLENGPITTHNSKTLPPAPAWNHPAMLRTTIFNTPNSTFNRDSVISRTGFINPADTPDSGGTINVSTEFNARVVNADCNAAATAGSACSIRITNLASLGGGIKYLHVQALYVPTNITVVLLDGSHGVGIEDVQASIDVTGRAGDVYRRVEARVSLIPNDFPFPDLALWSNEEICKNFTVTDNPVDYSNLDCAWAN